MTLHAYYKIEFIENIKIRTRAIRIRIELYRNIVSPKRFETFIQILATLTLFFCLPVIAERYQA
jgi:hypothetical protein